MPTYSYSKFMYDIVDYHYSILIHNINGFISILKIQTSVNFVMNSHN